MLALASASLIFASSYLPLCSVLLIFIYQMSVKNAPSMPSFSDYYFTSWRGVLLASFALSLFASLVYSLVFKLKIRWRDIKSLPNIKSACILSAAFLLNGAFSGEWLWQSLAYGALQIVSFFLIGYIFLIAFRGLGREHLLDYFTCLCAAIALVLVLETVNLYLFGGVVSGGEAQKGLVLYGWGIWTTAGMDMAVLIPVLFLGALRSRRQALYLLLAHATYISSLLTLSRNALTFATLALAVSAALYIRYADNARPLLRVYIGVGILVIFALPLYVDDLSLLFSDLLNRGFSDNGRFALWKYGLDSFLDAPLFGKGFFALETDTFRAENFFPPMLHNTAVQLLASMGLFGFFAYSFYRVNMLRSLIKRIDYEGAFLLVSMLTLLFMSLFDNFVFHVQPMFLFSAEYAILWSVSKN